MLRKKHFVPGLIRALHQRLDDPATPEEAKTAIAKALTETDGKPFGKLLNFVFKLAQTTGLADKPEVVGMASGAVGAMLVTGPFFDWVKEMFAAHWTEILALLLKLFGI